MTHRNVVSRHRPRLMLVVSLATGQAVAVGVPSVAAAPPVTRNPNRAHVTVFSDSAAPDIKLYETRATVGEPAIYLNDRGLFFRGQLQCSWPGGTYDAARESDNVLQGCPPGMPVISGYGDHGVGSAALWVEVFARRGAIVETKYNGISFYLDLNALRAHPRTPLDSSFALRPKPGDDVGWEWLLSEKEAARREAIAAGRLSRQPAFARFRREVTACVRSTRAPDCLTPFVSSAFYYPDAEPVLGTHTLTPMQFVRFVWEASHPDGANQRLWTELVECFTHGRMTNARSAGVNFKTRSGFTCVVERGAAGWTLTDFYQADSPAD